MASVHFLHGFLGRALDWSSVLGAESEHSLWRCDFFSQGGLPLKGLDSLAEWVNVRASESVEPRFLVGYSFGGRVALHALLQNPEMWSGAVIVSAHPGLISSVEREERMNADLRWAERFLYEPWESLLKDWNAQPVLQTSLHRGGDRAEVFSREALAQAMSHCSLGKQRDLRPELRKLKVPVLWLSGERDAKFCALMKECVALNPEFRGEEVADAGHRVPWDQPEVFREQLMSFVKSCERTKK